MLTNEARSASPATTIKDFIEYISLSVHGHDLDWSFSESNIHFRMHSIYFNFGLQLFSIVRHHFYFSLILYFFSSCHGAVIIVQ